MAVRVKICGITRLQDLHAACAAGADALGFVFYEKSPRNVIGRDAPPTLLRAMPPFVQSVGLFVNAEPAFIDAVLQAVPLDLLQFHGDETPADCERYGRPYIKAVRVNPDTDLLKYAADFESGPRAVARCLRAGRGGRHRRTLRLEPDPGEPARPVILSGGLTPDNVAEAVQQVRPWAVDVSSGVEAQQRHQGRAEACAIHSESESTHEAD